MLYYWQWCQNYCRNGQEILRKERTMEKRKWDIDDVICEYDQNFNMTLRELSGRSGWSVKELKKILMGG